MTAKRTTAELSCSLEDDYRLYVRNEGLRYRRGYSNPPGVQIRTLGVAEQVSEPSHRANERVTAGAHMYRSELRGEFGRNPAEDARCLLTNLLGLSLGEFPRLVLHAVLPFEHLRNLSEHHV